MNQRHVRVILIICAIVMLGHTVFDKLSTPSTADRNPPAASGQPTKKEIEDSVAKGVAAGLNGLRENAGIKESVSIDVNKVPVIDAAIGTPSGSTTLITLKNSGVEPVVNVTVNLRCFLLRTPEGIGGPVLFYDGIESIDDSRSWWKIKSLNVGHSATHESVKEAASFIHNKEVTESSPGLRGFPVPFSEGDIRC